MRLEAPTEFAFSFIYHLRILELRAGAQAPTCSSTTFLKRKVNVEEQRPLASSRLLMEVRELCSRRFTIRGQAFNMKIKNKLGLADGGLLSRGARSRPR